MVKTETMIVASWIDLRKMSNNAKEAASFAIGDTTIDFVQGTKCLRLMFDQHLFWDDQVKVLQIKISRTPHF